MATMTELDKLAKSPAGRRGECPRCHEKTTKGFIQVTVSKYSKTEKSAKGAKHIKSKGRSMCGSCLVAVFQATAAEITKEG